MDANDGLPLPNSPLASRSPTCRENPSIANPLYPDHRPNHLITMLRPKPNNPPTLATFRVPLTFNKFDMRDYLLHAYKVETAGVRSLVAQQAIEKPEFGGRKRKAHRPRSIKYMIVELVKPFVWPPLPEGDAAAAWKQPGLIEPAIKQQEWYQAKIERTSKTGEMDLRDELPMNDDDKSLREQAKKLLEEGGWDNQRTPDLRFGEGGKK